MNLSISDCFQIFDKAPLELGSHRRVRRVLNTSSRLMSPECEPSRMARTIARSSTAAATASLTKSLRSSRTSTTAVFKSFLVHPVNGEVPSVATSHRLENSESSGLLARLHLTKSLRSARTSTTAVFKSFFNLASSIVSIIGNS